MKRVSSILMATAPQDRILRILKDWRQRQAQWDETAVAVAKNDI